MVESSDETAALEAPRNISKARETHGWLFAMKNVKGTPGLDLRIIIEELFVSRQCGGRWEKIGETFN